MSAYQLYLFVHVAAAIVWVGAAALQAVLGARAVREGNPARTLAFAGDAEWTGLRLYLPTNLLVLVSGLFLVHEGGWRYGTLWIEVGLAGWALSFATGAALLGPGWSRSARIEDPEGAGAAALRHAVRRLVLVTYVDLAVLTAVVFAMVVKPTGGGTEVAVGAAVVLTVLALGTRALRPAGRAVRPAPPGAGAEV